MLFGVSLRAPLLVDISAIELPVDAECADLWLMLQPLSLNDMLSEAIEKQTFRKLEKEKEVEEVDASLPVDEDEEYEDEVRMSRSDNNNSNHRGHAFLVIERLFSSLCCRLPTRTTTWWTT